MAQKNLDWQQVFGYLQNGLRNALKIIFPFDCRMREPKPAGGNLDLQFGVLIALTGDVRSRMVLAGMPDVFQSLAKSMYGMDLEGEMLASFSGELGNMIAGTLSQSMETNGLRTAVTAPTIMEGDTVLSGYDRAVKIPIELDSSGSLELFLLIDS